MRTILFCFLVIFALRVSAFGLSGAYKRIWYWSAYQIEQQYNDADDRSIATKCKSCSFAQFIAWIAEEADESSVKSKFAAYKAKNRKDYVPTSVDEGAKWLDDNNITRPMRLFRVVHDVYNMPNLFKRVSKAIGAINKSKHPNTSQPPFSDAFLTQKRVNTIRTTKSHLTISLALRTKYDPTNIDGTKPVYNGLVRERDNNSKRLPNSKVIPDCDLKSAIDTIQREKGITVSINNYYKSDRNRALKASGSDDTSKDDNHTANIEEIQRAKFRILEDICHNE